MTEKRSFTLEEIMAWRFPVIRPEIAAMLECITPTGDGRILYYPCSVKMKDGTEHRFVCFAEARSWLAAWAPLPGVELGRHHLDIRDIATLRECSSRLPPAFANRLYEAGESGMGFSIFTLRFSDGTSAAYCSGNAVDFIDYPEGKSGRDIVDLIPHVGRGDPQLRNAPELRWCIFEWPAEEV